MIIKKKKQIASLKKWPFGFNWLSWHLVIVKSQEKRQRKNNNKEKILESYL